MDYELDYNSFDFQDYEVVYDEEEGESNLIENCLKPTLYDGFNNLIGPILISNLSLKFLLFLIKKASPSKHDKTVAISTVACGMALLFYFLRDHLMLGYMFVLFSVSGSFLSIFTIQKKTNTLIWAYCFSVLIINEVLLIYYPDGDSIKLRPLLMGSVMKLVSVINFFDIKDHIQDFRSLFLSVLSFILHPSSLLLGTWHPPFQSSLSFPLLKTFSALFFSLTSLVLSTCVLQFYFIDHVYHWLPNSIRNWLPDGIAIILDKLLDSYFVAVQFRTSHYFICYLTQTTFSLWNHKIDVVKPSQVELPRSLVNVVVAWNIPMHTWLRMYVFKPLKQQYSPLISVFGTYLISSFIHGLNFQIWSVLLTLGILTWVEFQLRKKLSVIFNACIEARKCPTESKEVPESINYLPSILKSLINGNLKCRSKHQQTSQSCWVILTNFLFFLLAVLHLAYLGASFDGKEESSKFENVMEIWKHLGFYSHLIAIMTILIYFLI